jgi:hypothetical protein
MHGISVKGPVDIGKVKFRQAFEHIPFSGIPASSRSAAESPAEDNALLFIDLLGPGHDLAV